MKSFFMCCSLLAALGAAPVSGFAADNLSEARVIVKLKNGSALKQIQAAGRVQSLGQRIGVVAQFISQPAPDLQVMRARGMSSEALAKRLAQEPDVEYAVPDRLKTIRSIPNDPFFSYQWYLQNANSTQPAATNAQSAWALTPGSANVVVAVIDSGVRFDHEDLAAKLLPGYDFIGNDALSGDGQAGRDADASDPGDYLSDSDLRNSSLQAVCGNDLTTHDSSWHGTQVAGILAAHTNNGLGIAGMGGATRILPVRVLGKCGGYDSDIIAGMRWAAGLSVSGVSNNPNPARILNLSLAGAGTCSAAYADAVAQIRAAGVLIVAAAGNETSPVEEPANCAGVLAVTGVRHVGTKVGYSSFGPEASIAAPAGNCVNIGAGEPCLYPFINTINTGYQTPLSNSYTLVHAVTIGTSFSAPLVAGTAALMLAANPNLGEAELATRIKRSARVFPVDNTLPACPTVTSDGQCNCTSLTCGAGLLNAAAAVSAALDGNAVNPLAVLQVSSGNYTTNSTLALSASGSSAAGSASLVRWHWSQVGGPAAGTLGSDTPSTTFTTSTPGDYVLRLEVTDSAGRSGATDLAITISQPSSGGGGGAFDPWTLAGLLAAAVVSIKLRKHPTP